MEEFIKALMNIDNEMLEEIKSKIKNNIRLEEYEEFYLIQIRKFIERYKIRNEKTKSETNKENK